MRIIKKFIRRDKPADAIIRDLDKIYQEQIASEQKQILSNKIMQNQVDLVKELIKERNEVIKYERREQS